MTKTDLRTQAFVLRRTNYGEADRIINFLTPQGKISALAKGVRREQSKLAGNIEMFCLVEITVHFKPNSDDKFGILTSARIVQNYPKIMADLATLEFASDVVKRISRAAENLPSADFFDLLKQVFTGVEQGVALELIKAWLRFQLAQAAGEPFNLHRDTTGAKLAPDQNYLWDTHERALHPSATGPVTTDTIKLARLLAANRLATAAKIRDIQSLFASLDTIF